MPYTSTYFTYAVVPFDDWAEREAMRLWHEQMSKLRKHEISIKDVVPFDKLIDKVMAQRSWSYRR